MWKASVLKNILLWTTVYSIGKKNIIKFLAKISLFMKKNQGILLFVSVKIYIKKIYNV